MNELGVEAAVYGNHEFDFGIDPLRNAMQNMNFPWLCSNLKNKDGSIPSNAVNNRNEPSGVEKLIRKWTLEDGTEVKVGMMGLIEYEWLQTLGMVNFDDFEYSDYVQVA